MSQVRRGITRVAPWVLACALAVLPHASEALGLGNLRVLSTLNEPLSGEIDLTSVSDRELKGLSVTLAPPEVYATAGVERLAYLSRIKFIVSKRADGSYFLRLTSEEPFDEPFLHLLLQIEWPGTRLVREYTALIDLPTQVPSPPARVQVPQTAAAPVEPLPTLRDDAIPPLGSEPAAPPEPVIAPAPEPQRATRPSEPLVEPRVPTTARAEDDLFGPPDTGPSKIEISPVTGWPEPVKEAPAPVVTELAPRAPESTPATARAAEPTATVGEYHVSKGDTLWEISERVRSDRGIAVEQVVMAIFRVNPDAFFGKNVNNLRAGKILRVPEREEIESVSVADARREFRAQYDVWQEYKLKLAGAGQALKVAEAQPAEPAIAEPVTPKPTQEKPKATAAAPKEAKKPEPVGRKTGQEDELLKIVRAEAEGKKAKPDKQVAQTEAPKDAATREQQALSDRVTTLEESLVSKQLETKELGDKIGIVRDQLKREARLIEIEKKAPEVAAKKPEPPAPKVETPKPVEAPTPPAVAEAPKAAEPTKAAEAPAAAPAAEKPKPPVAPKPVTPPPAPEKSALDEFLDAVLGGELMPVLLGVVVLAAGAIGFVYVRRRRRSIAEFEESILSAEAASHQTASTTDATGQAVASGDTSFLSDFSQGGMGNIHTDEVDPIAEAEVYLAYGRDETAEEILKEAVVKNPQREELKVKLLEIYHQRNDVNAFSTLAEELYAQTGGKGGRHWEKVADMGRKLDPENPMFKGGKPGARPAVAAAGMAAAPAMTDTLRGLESEPPTVAKASDHETLDFDFAAETTQPPASAGGGAGLDFDLGATDAEVAAESVDFGSTDKTTGESVDFGSTLKMDQPIDFGAESSSSTDSGLDSLDFGSGAASQDHGIDFAPSKPSAPVEELDFGGADVAVSEPEPDLSAPTPVREEAGLQAWDETATKLDLAKAYIDMGDADGARSILDEVMAEGNDQQKKQARDLAAQIR